MHLKTKIGGFAVASTLLLASAVSAQDVNAVPVAPVAPVPLAPIGEVEGDPNPTFRWNAVANATNYVLVVRKAGSANSNRYVFLTSGSRIIHNPTGSVVCQIATAGECSFTPSDLDLTDGQQVAWVIGARNASTTGNRLTFQRPGARFQYFAFPAPAQAIGPENLHGPRGNIAADSGANAGAVREAANAPVFFEWKNFGDASSYDLIVVNGADKNQLILQETIPAAAANCTTEVGLMDTCSFAADPVNSPASNGFNSDFCWGVVASNARSAPVAPNVDEFACYASR